MDTHIQGDYSNPVSVGEIIYKLISHIDILVNSWALRVVSLINLVNYMPHVRKHLGILASRSNLTFRFFSRSK